MHQALTPAQAATWPLERPSTATLATRPVDASPGNAAAVPGASIGNPLWAIPVDSLSATRERPLFSPSRRPPAKIVAAPPPPPPSSKPAPPSQPPLSIVGTAVGDNQSLGIFVDQSTKEIVRLRVGEGYGGWTLRSIHGRGAVLEQDQRKVTLALPANDGKDQPTSIAQSTQSPQQAGNQPRVAPPPGKWFDGDGQTISPPPSPVHYGGSAPPRAATWVDGDGQLIAPPPGN